IHLDIDVLNPAVMPAVDSPVPGGLMPDELVDLLVPFVRHPQSIGLDVSIYDPAFDADRSCARLIVGLLERLVARAESGAVTESDRRPAIHDAKHWQPPPRCLKPPSS